MVDPTHDPVIMVYKAAVAFCRLARAMTRRARRWEQVARIWWTRLMASAAREKTLQEELEKSRADFNHLHATLWKRIDETREKGRVDLLKIAALQQELAMCKEARKQLRDEQYALWQAEVAHLCEKHLEWTAEAKEKTVEETNVPECTLCKIDVALKPLRKSIDGLHRQLSMCKEARKDLRVELTVMREAAEHRNRELDALHYVWCSGGCEKGTHRYCDSPDEITEETVQIIERQATRLRSWFENHREKQTP